MKSFYRLFICCFLSFLLSFSVCADSFTDSCSSDESDTQRETYNLSSASSHLAEVDFPAMEDTTALSVSDLTSPGEIIYAVQGVEEVSVSLYRSYASFVVEYPDGKLEYNVLPPEGEEYHILPLWLDETDDSVYCLSNGNYYPLFFDSLQQKILVSDEPVVPKPELVIYGLKIMESSDGISFQEVDYERTYTGRYVNSTSDFLFDETFHASLSPSCRYLKIQIKQFSRIQTQSPSGMVGSTDIVTPYSAMIRKVTCTGENLPLNPDGGADLPSGEEENTFYGEKTKEHPLPKVQPLPRQPPPAVLEANHLPEAPLPLLNILPVPAPLQAIPTIPAHPPAIQPTTIISVFPQKIKLPLSRSCSRWELNRQQLLPNPYCRIRKLSVLTIRFRQRLFMRSKP